MKANNQLSHGAFLKVKKEAPLFTTDDDDEFFERFGRTVDKGIGKTKSLIKSIPSKAKAKAKEIDDWVRSQKYKRLSRKWSAMGLYHDDELNHYGIPGMKWGHRRWRNVDGSLTDAGLARYGRKYQRMAARSERRQNKAIDSGVKADKWLAKANDYESGTFFRRQNPAKAANLKRKGLNARWKASKKLAKERKREQKMDKALNRRFNPTDSARIRRDYLSNYSYWR